MVDPLAFKKTIPSPRVCAGVAVLPWSAGATTSSSAVPELKGPHTFCRLNGVKLAFELTEWKPSFATAIPGPSSSPHGWTRLRATATVCPPGIAVDPGSVPFTAIPSQVTWRNPVA